MKAFFLLVFLVFSLSVYAQETKIGIDPERPLSNLSMDQWTGRDGLVSNNLTSVNQVSSKFIWITSFNGILRFDGTNFKLFDKKSLPFLNSNGFYQSYEDSKGNIWFTSQSSGVIKYTNHEFSAFLNEEQRALSVRCIKEDEHGNFWLGTFNNGVYYLKDTILSKLDFKEFNSLSIMDIEIDDDGKVWFASNGKGILILDESEVSIISSADGDLNNNTVNKLLKSTDGKIYAGTADGVCIFSQNEIRRLSVLDNIEINDLLIDDYENLWVGSEQGLYKLHLPTNTFDSFKEEDGLPASQISAINFDHENSLWVSTKKAGLIRFRDGFFENITAKDHLSSDNVNIVVEHENAFYIGCDDGLINVYRDNNVERFNIKSSYYNVGIRDINFTEDGQVLVASYRGLLTIKDGKEELFDLEKHGLSNDVRRILNGKDGTVWLATRSSGVVKLKGLSEVTNYNSSNGLMSDYILALEEGNDGEIYVGTHSGGLSVIKENGEFLNYPIEGGKSGILIFNIEILKDNSVFIATNIGIYKIVNESLKKIDLDENLNAETIFDIITENETAWLSSNIGLIKVSIIDLNNFIDGKITSVPGRLFDRYDGMASQECTGATRMTLSKDGKLWVPTLGGVAVLNPKNIVENSQIPEVYVTELVTDSKDRDLTKNQDISIEPGVIRYEFYFTSLSYVAPPKVRFKYKLVGIDNDWIDAGNEREAIYTSLPKGKYSFNVMASNNDGIWNERGASVKFEVQPFFYETIYFYAFVLICLGLIVWGIVVWRIHNISRVNAELLKLNEELDRFVYSASHDLRAPLSSVMGLVEVAKLESSTEGKDKCLSMINDSIHKLDGFINDIIDYSRNQRIEVQADKVDLEFEINDVFQELKFLDKEGEIEKTYKIYEKRHFMTDGRRINIILKNLVSNAIRYHDSKKNNQFIKIDVSYNVQSVTINVADNGIGIDENHLENIFKMFYRADEASKGSGLGLYIVKETVEKLGGTIGVNSRLNEGTTFTITLPSLKPAG